MKLETSFNYVLFYAKYLGLPLTLGWVIQALFSKIYQHKKIKALKGKVVVITGASSGIGESLAHVFYEAGSKVILAARRESELNRVKQDLTSKTLASQTLEPVVLRLDLADTENMEKFVDKVYDICGHIDIVINNGGVSHRASILSTKLEVDKQIMTINYFGPVALTKAVLPKMVERKNGHILFVSSVQGLVAIPDRSAYAASKHALQAFGDCLRAEMKQHNIDVSVISPGYIRTSISLNALTGSGDTHGVMDSTTAAGFTPEYCAQNILNMIVKKQNEMVLSQFMPKLAIFLRHTSPSLYFWIMSKRATKTTL